MPQVESEISKLKIFRQILNCCAGRRTETPVGLSWALEARIRQTGRWQDEAGAGKRGAHKLAAAAAAAVGLPQKVASLCSTVATCECEFKQRK